MTVCVLIVLLTRCLQELVQRSIDETEKAVLMVNELSLFSANEDIEEIATSDLRFLLKLVSFVR